MNFLRASLGLALAVLVAAPAAADPKGWEEVGRSEIPLVYYQGMTHDEDGNRYFSGHVGLFKTDGELNETDRNNDVLAELHASEGYNHIGDLDYFDGKLYLPLECYYFIPGEANTCKTGSIAVADPDTLEIDYYVKLDPAEISKAMWCQVSPDGTLLWTQEGDDLLAYDMAQITEENAAPDADPIHSVIKLEGAVPEPGITGATFIGDRLFTAGGVNHDGRDNDGAEIWSTDLATGEQKLETSVNFIGEAEGLDSDWRLHHKVDRLEGYLHFMVQPYNDEYFPTNGIANGVVYHFDH